MSVSQSVSIHHASNEDGYTAGKAEERKQRKYGQEKLSGNSSSPEFTPLVFESFGRWGEGAETYLAKRSRDDEGHRNEAEFRGYWRRRPGILLQRCNAHVIQKKLLKMLPAEVDELDCRDTQYMLH